MILIVFAGTVGAVLGFIALSSHGLGAAFVGALIGSNGAALITAGLLVLRRKA